MNVRLRPIAGQVIVITGASSGIGLLTARDAARRGAKVMLVARNGAALAEIVAGIEAEGGEAAFAVADVGDAAAVAAAAEAAVARFGRIDTWVNNAGVTIYAPILETPDDEHARLFRTNYFGAVHGARAAVPHLRVRGGALITVASIAADMPSPIMGAYAASKHAVKALIGSLRIELQAAGAPIVVTLVKPSGIATPIAQHAANHQAGEAMIPPPPYDPQLVADAILHAAEHPTREIVVGGAGRLQSLFASHFPALFDRLAPAVIPFLSSRKPPTRSDALHAPAVDGAVRSANETGEGWSFYTAGQLHPGKAAIAGATAALVLAGLVRAVSARRRGNTG